MVGWLGDGLLIQERAGQPQLPTTPTEPEAAVPSESPLSQVHAIPALLSEAECAALAAEVTSDNQRSARLESLAGGANLLPSCSAAGVGAFYRVALYVHGGVHVGRAGPL